MANIAGARITTNITQDRRVVDMSKDIALLDPNAAPFITITKTIKGGNNIRKVYNPKFEWLEDDYLGNSTALSAELTNVATSVSVDDGSIFRVNDVITIPATGENMLVTAISNNTLTVTRGYGGVAAAAAAADDVVIIIGNAFKENSLMRDRLSTKEVAKYNYTQIFRTPIELSGTEEASKLYGGKDKAYQRKKALVEHKRDIALSMYFGQKKEDTTSGVRRTMGGLLEFIKTGSNIQEFKSGSTGSEVNFTYKNFVTYVAEPAFRHGSDNKLLIGGPTTMAAIMAWDADKLMTEVGADKTFGVSVKKLVTPFGTLDMVYDPLLNGDIYGGYGLILDMENIRYAYMEGRDTKLHTNIQANDQDGVVDEYFTECSLEVKLPDTHFLFTGAYVA